MRRKPSKLSSKWYSSQVVRAQTSISGLRTIALPIPGSSEHKRQQARACHKREIRSHPSGSPCPNSSKRREPVPGAETSPTPTSPPVMRGSHVPRSLPGGLQPSLRQGCHVRGRKRSGGWPGAAPLRLLSQQFPSCPLSSCRSLPVSRLPATGQGCPAPFPRPRRTALSHGVAL